ncbi:hypothetical protein [Microbacterium invictum]|uniref:ABC transmembrane type-1 domain-containing protein n=1 Tax=Microbacterium invictum TaxID=515415 RepID=A0ABZ0VDS7_9MICO|nr:hypothetical protein [Microbacterium invictum]WQB70670.1 hypothetical protein T9R20_01560 [Microbacterium invictum]
MTDESDARNGDLLAVLNTEYFVLQGASGASISEASSRASLYLLTLSSSLVSLGFVLGLSADVFGPFAAAALSTVFLLGCFTVVRLTETSIENLRALRGMARIRAYYADLSPLARPYFVSAGSVAADAQAMLGRRSNRWWWVGTMATMIGAVNAVVGGSGIALLTTAAGASLSLSVATGLGAAVVLVTLAVQFQRRRFATEFAGS